MAVGKTPPRIQQQLARELLRLRTRAGLDQREVGKRVGVSQATVSRAEHAEKLLSIPQVKAWGEACGISDAAKDRLLALAEATFTQMEAWRDLMPASSHLQDAVGKNESTTKTLLGYAPVVIPGLLQTPAYAEHVLRLTNYTGDEDEAAALAGRWRRQQALADRSRRFGFLLTEGVLRWSPAGLALMAEQLDRVATVAAQDNVSVGVIRDGDEDALPFHPFQIYADRGTDDPFVTIELLHTYITEYSPDHVDLYQRIYDRMERTAVSGSDAIAMIQRVAAELRD